MEIMRYYSLQASGVPMIYNRKTLYRNLHLLNIQQPYQYGDNFKTVVT